MVVILMSILMVLMIRMMTRTIMRTILHDNEFGNDDNMKTATMGLVFLSTNDIADN